MLSHLLYPEVFQQFAAHRREYADVSGLPTPQFFYGLEPGEEVAVDIEPGKRLIVKFLAVGSPHPDGTRTVFFELNGQPRDVTVQDRSLEPDAAAAVKADPADENQVGSPMPGMVVTVAVQPGDRVKAGQKLLTIEAMKMQTNLAAERDGVVKAVNVAAGSQVAAGDLLVTLEA